MRCQPDNFRGHGRNFDDGLPDGLIGRRIERRPAARTPIERNVDMPIDRIVIRANPEAALVPALSPRPPGRIVPLGPVSGKRRCTPHGLALEFLEPPVKASKPRFQLGNPQGLPFGKINEISFGEGFKLGSIHSNRESRS
jgi:hypothetical protein